MIGRVQLRRARHALVPVGDPAKARVVVEADPHSLCCEGGWGRDSGKNGQNDDEADDTSHEWSPKRRRVGGLKLRAP